MLKISCFCILQLFASCFAALNLTVLHVNDIHVRFEETSKYSGNCKPSQKEKGQCYGGLARLKRTVDNIKTERDNVIFLNGGDFYQGTVWYTHFKWRIVAHFAELMDFTAMSPGNHEFDDGIEGFEPFLAKTTFPIVCCNLDYSEAPELKGDEHILPSLTMEIDGVKIGIIGYVIKTTPALSNPGKVKFIDEVQAVNQEAQKLKTQGVKILIALGHAGFDIDKQIAEKVPDIDVVVGGHSNTFLYTGDPPSNEEPEGTYPFIVTQPSQKKVPVVQAYAYTKYLGDLQLSFDDNGDLISYGGNPILLVQSMPEDQTILSQLKPYKEDLEELMKEIIGSTKIDLETYRNRESPLGNFITDSMVNWHLGDNKDVSIGLINSGGIRGGFEIGEITTADMLAVLPFKNSIDLITMKGKHIREALQDSAGRLSADRKFSSGGFLQVSGIKMTIDLGRSKDNRVTELKVKCTQCTEPIYEDLIDDQSYNVSITNYLANNGGDRYMVFPNNKLSQLDGPLDTDVFIKHLQANSPVTKDTIKVQNRITIIGGTSGAIMKSISIFPILCLLVLIKLL